MRDLLTSNAPEARLAVDYFVYRAAKEIGALAAVLGGIDGLVFTAGIGENSPEIRRRICEASAWLGVELDARANGNGDARISTQTSKVSTWVIPTNEELMIARHTGALLGLTATPAHERVMREQTEVRRTANGYCYRHPNTSKEVFPHGRDSRLVSGKRRSMFATSSSRTTSHMRERGLFLRLQPSGPRICGIG